MRQLKCKECGQQFKTAQKSYTPKYCGKPCYWKSLKTPETTQYEQYKTLRKNVQYILHVLLPLVLVVAFIVFASLYFLRS